MTYLQFLLIFLVLPIVAMVAFSQNVRTRGTAAIILFTSLLALVYTTPWDHTLIALDVWGYGDERVLGTFWLIPWEEYGFFVLQVAFTTLLTVILLRRFGWKD